MGYGLTIKTVRKKSGLTQAQLAEKCGMATVTIRQYEAEKRQPRIEQIQAIATALGVDVLDLMGLTPQERKDAERDALNNEAWERLRAALLEADDSLVHRFDKIPDSDIDTHLHTLISDELNRKGRILTLKRAYELSLVDDCSRFRLKRSSDTKEDKK